MRKVLHVGPCNSRGGMATVMHTLAEHPPTGWQAELLSSHAEGGVWSKWRAYRRARRELLRRFADEGLRPDVVHVHVAADWSWRRKVRFITLARAHGLPVVVHLHSGQFDTWLSRGGEKRQQRVRSVCWMMQAFMASSCPWLGKKNSRLFLGLLKWSTTPILLSLPQPMSENNSICFCWGAASLRKAMILP